jgi:hypothetical protein
MSVHAGLGLGTVVARPAEMGIAGYSHDAGGGGGDFDA